MGDAPGEPAPREPVPLWRNRDFQLLRGGLSPSDAMTIVAAGMAVTAIAATALAPVRDAGRPTSGASRPAGAAGTAPVAR